MSVDFAELPEAGAWPCQQSPNHTHPRLVAAWYVLLRDHVQPGDIEQVLLNLRGTPADAEHAFTNPHLEGLARAHVTFLLGELVEVVDPPPSPASAGVERLVALILEEMPAATARDHAADGPVGNEEQIVWGRIKAAAQEVRAALEDIPF